MSNNRVVTDRFLKGITYTASFISLFILLSILSFVFLNGFKLINMDLITHNYESKSFITVESEPNQGTAFTIQFHKE